ncbi:MAG: fumarylacetoacetase [Flavobacteriales bacterium]|nr:fumarylacetoacetase [Flavobacteriales bacterium]
MKSWIPIPVDSDFTIHNIPFGIFSNEGQARAGVAIGEQVLDLSAIHDAGLLEGIGLPTGVFGSPVLNGYIALGKIVWTATRQRLIQLLSLGNSELRGNENLLKKCLFAQRDVIMHLPVQVGDYTDFYSSREHATNVGTMFRDPANALLPNWLHLPVGYHGRASSIVISGTPFHRPKGQTMADDATAPTFGPTRLLDFELEMAFIIGQPNALGEPVSVEKAEDHIFGMVLFNDWSARDIQKWEYVPLGPFLAKNFASHVSPWIVTMDALEPFRVESPKQEPEVLSYLKSTGEHNFDIALEVQIVPDGQAPHTICRSNFKYMYWSMAQQLAHHTVNGCNMRVGDMCASGTISGPTPDSYGSMLEISWKGTRPVQMPDGTERKFILDGDTVIMKGHCERNGIRIGFGEVAAKVLPAKN